MFAKQGHVRLEGEAYRVFKEHIHELDEWRCRCCGKVNPGLTLHHLIRRSKRRLDVDWNVISLCVSCHEREQRGEIQITWACVDQRIPRITRRS